MEKQEVKQAISFLSDEERELKIEKMEEEMDINKEKKKYLILLKLQNLDNTDSEPIRDFEIIIGRKTTYDFLKDLIISETILIHESHVLTSNVNLEKMLSVYQFMKLMEERDYFPDDSFDIEEYN